MCLFVFCLFVFCCCCFITMLGLQCDSTAVRSLWPVFVNEDCVLFSVRYLYWASITEPKIYRNKMDGEDTEPTLFVHYDVAGANITALTLAFEKNGGRLYWSVTYLENERWVVRARVCVLCVCFVCVCVCVWWVYMHDCTHLWYLNCMCISKLLLVSFTNRFSYFLFYLCIFLFF